MSSGRASGRQTSCTIEKLNKHRLIVASCLMFSTLCLECGAGFLALSLRTIDLVRLLSQPSDQLYRLVPTIVRHSVSHAPWSLLFICKSSHCLRPVLCEVVICCPLLSAVAIKKGQNTPTAAAYPLSLISFCCRQITCFNQIQYTGYIYLGIV